MVPSKVYGSCDNVTANHYDISVYFSTTTSKNDLLCFIVVFVSLKGQALIVCDILLSLAKIVSSKRFGKLFLII